MSETPYSQPHPLLVAYAPEYEKQHYHLHGRNIEQWEALKSVFLDEHFEMNKFFRKVLKGAVVGGMYGIIARNFIVRGPKSFELDRIWMKRKGSPLMHPMRGYTAFGAMMGGGWYLIKDVICLPHGQDSYMRHLMAYGLLGALLVGTILHPANSFWGFVLGSTLGGCMLSIYEYTYPKNFELRMKNFDEERRRTLLRQDEESELSGRNFLLTTTNLYPL